MELKTLKIITSPSDIFIKTSNDNGKTFGEEINLSNSTGIQSTRAEIVASGDNVYVSWWDKVRWQRPTNDKNKQ